MSTAPPPLLTQLTAPGTDSASGTSTFWASLAAQYLAERRELELRHVEITGAPVTPRLVADLRQVAPAAEIVAVYDPVGGRPVASATGDEILAAVASGTLHGWGALLGTPVPAALIQLRAGDGSEVESDAVGELSVRIDDKTVPTGDLARRSPDGRLWLMGQAGATIFYRESALYPVPVEAVAETLPWIRRAALVGLPGAAAEPNERAVLAVELAPDDDLPDDWQVQLRDRCVGALGSFPVDGIQVLEAVPLLAPDNRRIDYLALRQELVDLDSPAHMLAWLRERFPLAPSAAFAISFFAANYAVAWVTTFPGHQAILFSWRFFAGALALLAMFLHLRVIEEQRNAVYLRRSPGARALSRGLVSLRGLGRLALLAVAIELVLSAAMGSAPAVGCLVVVALSGLMWRAWFAGHWLGRHRLASASLDLLVVPACVLYVYTVTTLSMPWTAPMWMLAAAAAQYAAALALAFSRGRAARAGSSHDPNSPSGMLPSPR
jgi:hypothetical protein